MLKKKIKLQAASDDFPHLLVYGPSGSGKSTRIACTLRELFGEGALRVCIFYLLNIRLTTCMYEICKI